MGPQRSGAIKKYVVPMGDAGGGHTGIGLSNDGGNNILGSVLTPAPLWWWHFTTTADSGDAKPEFPPLLPLGRHPHTVAEITTLCVDAFTASTTRKDIMRGLVELIDKLTAAGIVGEVWVDGSFLTKKVDPEDVDIILCLDASFHEACTIEQLSVIDWVAGDLHDCLRCHSFVFTRWAEGHPNFWFGECMYANWMKQRGFSRADALKGIAVVQLTGSGGDE